MIAVLSIVFSAGMTERRERVSIIKEYDNSGP
jgi:hypothetical protein